MSLRRQAIIRTHDGYFVSLSIGNVALRFRIEFQRILMEEHLQDGGYFVSASMY